MGEKLNNMHPYSNLLPAAFWKTGVTQEDPFLIKNIYKKKFRIEPHTLIATAGSCFAQHISSYLKKNGYRVLDEEQAPPEIPQDLHHKYGYSMYSARYGNIYTVKQLLQLTQEVAGDREPIDFVWEKNGKYFDALRPSIEPEGYENLNDLVENRKFHINKVRSVFKKMNLFIFTLGLTEMWIHKKSNTVYPSAPGIIAGEYDKNIYEFRNSEFQEIIKDFKEFQETLLKIRNYKKCQFLLTVSPVPLTATASGKHILVSNTYSKSILRAVAGQLSNYQKNVDYFPSYELVNNPKMINNSYDENLRTIKYETVKMVMDHFSREHPPLYSSNSNVYLDEDISCEEELLETFAKSEKISFKHFEKNYIQILGNSHMTSFKEALFESNLINKECKDKCLFHARNFLKTGTDYYLKRLGHMHIKPEDYAKNANNFSFCKFEKPPEKIILFPNFLFGYSLIGAISGMSTVEMQNSSIYLEPISSINKDKYYHLVSERLDDCIRQIQRILDIISPNNLRLIEHPIYTEKCARYLLGDEFVDSKSFVDIRNFSEDYFNKNSKNFSKEIFIFHEKDMQVDNGFTKNEYHKSHRPIYDVHPNSNYYQGCIKNLKDFIT